MAGPNDGQTDQGCDQVILVGQRLDPGHLKDMFASLLVPLGRQSNGQAAVAKDQQFTGRRQAEVDRIQPVVLWELNRGKWNTICKFLCCHFVGQ